MTGRFFEMSQRRARWEGPERSNVCNASLVLGGNVHRAQGVIDRRGAGVATARLPIEWPALGALRSLLAHRSSSDALLKDLGLSSRL
jgi:hypothetical protein